MKRTLKKLTFFTLLFIPLIMSFAQTGQANYLSVIQVTFSLPWEDQKADVYIDPLGTAHYVYVSETANLEGEVKYGNNSNPGDMGLGT